MCDISSVGRAIPCQGIGHQFEPDMSLQILKLILICDISSVGRLKDDTLLNDLKKQIDATLAQLVERYLAKV